LALFSFHPFPLNLNLFKAKLRTTSMQTQTLEKPAWLKMKETELKKIIAELAKTTDQPAKIGTILRDQYGIPTTKLYGKKLVQYLKELKIESKTELDNAKIKLDKIKNHLKKNITDRKAKHKLQKAQTRVQVLKKYFNKKK